MTWLENCKYCIKILKIIHHFQRLTHRQSDFELSAGGGQLNSIEI